MPTKVLGIIGGMGPAATVDLFSKIVSNTEAETDQQHLHILIDNNTNVLDRTAAILEGSDAPLAELLRSARGLEAQGADLLLMACNTAHYFYDKVAEAVGVPILHMIEETAAHLKGLGISKAGLLATDGVLRSGLYTQALRRQGIEPVLPTPDLQQHVMDIIYNCVKCDRYDRFNPVSFLNLLVYLRRQGSELLVLGCTELPLAFDKLGIIEPAVDPTLLLARASIKAAGGRLKGD